MAENYASTLQGPDLDRYVKKLQCLFGRVGESYMSTLATADPYQFPSTEWIDDILLWPPVDFPSLYTYFIDAPGGYTREKLKAYKSLEAYNYYQSGWVQTVLYHSIGINGTHCILKAKVNPSQKLNDKPHEPWVAVEKRSGSIVTAHCTCMAGLGEVCSHVAAVLFKVEACNRLGINTQTSTSLPCVWNQAFSKKVKPSTIQEINFERPKVKGNHCSNISTSSLHPLPVLNKVVLFDAIHKVYPSASLFTVTPGYESATFKASQQRDVECNLPPLLTSFYDPKHSQCTSQELVKLSETVHETIKYSLDEISFIEKCTRGQSHSTLWFDYRLGRITASVFGQVVKCTEKVFPMSLVKSIMQYTSVNPNIPSLKWGHLHEVSAKQEYVQIMKNTHQNFSLSDNGLFISKDYPYLGASPDGIIDCTCCGSGTVEVKCPYKYKDVNPWQINDKKCFLQLGKDGNLSLSMTHDYYYQVQGQLAICNKPYCDFICWTTKGIFFERIFRDANYFDSILPSLKAFFLKYILPELLTNSIKSGLLAEPASTSCSVKMLSISRSNDCDDMMEQDADVCQSSSSEQDDVPYCICRQKAFGPMIGCDAPECSIEWYHFSCVGIVEEPEGEWYCNECIALINGLK